MLDDSGGGSSVGRASASQAEGREFEPRPPLSANACSALKIPACRGDLRASGEARRTSSHGHARPRMRGRRPILRRPSPPANDIRTERESRTGRIGARRDATADGPSAPEGRVVRAAPRGVRIPQPATMPRLAGDESCLHGLVEMVAPDAPILADLVGRKRGGAEICAERYRPGGRRPAHASPSLTPAPPGWTISACSPLAPS
jgi:hypothetical protein